MKDICYFCRNIIQKEMILMATLKLISVIIAVIVGTNQLLEINLKEIQVFLNMTKRPIKMRSKKETYIIYN